MRLPIILALSLMLFSGCAMIDGGPEIRGNSQNSSIGQGGVSGNAINYAPQQSPPGNLTKNATPAAPAKNETGATPASAQPTYFAYRQMNAGESLDFQGGSLTLLDVWSGNPGLPAAMAVFGPRGENRTEFQLLAGQSRAYLSPSGRSFWIYAKSTDAGATTGLKRAQVFVFEAREGGKPFDKQLYSWEIGNESAESIPASGAFSWFVSSGLLNRSGLLQGSGSLKMQFEDLRAYPQDGSVAMVKVWDDYTEPSYASIPLGHAYVFAPANSVKYLFYYGAGGVGEATGKPIGEFQVFAAGPLVQGKDRIYGIEGFAQLPPEKKLVGRFDLKAGQPTPTTRDFYLRHTYLRMLDCSSGPNGFVSALAEDEAQKPSGFGIMGPGYPMRFKDGFNLSYTAWLQSASCINRMATVAVYKD